VGFHRPLRNVQVASDFRVITPLQKQLDDLLFPGTHLADRLIHVVHLSDEALVAVQWPKQEPAHISRVFAYKNVHEFDHSGVKRLTKCEIS
jgi:hypothetical protein